VTEAAINRYYRRFKPLADTYGYRFARQAVSHSGKPNVLFLGNHSAGKSTFINFLVGGIDVQDTGVAPTDDGFTLLRYGNEETDICGPAALRYLGEDFASLERMGPSFLRRLKVKIRNRTLLQQVNLIDSPGMIDAANSNVKRDYDFMAAVRRMADISDIVIFMFDPDKPGTTGETLKCLRECLVGMEFKLHILLNKADSFQNMYDFARACGALCWNLARAMRSKDLPRIYTTYVPDVRIGESAMPLSDFDRYRDEIVDQVRNAGQRRVDNMIAMARTDLPRLAMHVRVLATARRTELRAKWCGLLSSLAIATTATLICGAAAWANEWNRFGIWAVAILAFCLFSILALWLARLIVARHLAKGERSLDKQFENIYAGELATDKRDDLQETWQALHENLPRILRTLRRTLPAFPGRDLRRLEKVIEKDLPKLGDRLPR
jgi:hypothetical protein